MADRISVFLSERVLIASPQKIGTHLVQEPMLELDFKTVGATHPSSRNTPAEPMKPGRLCVGVGTGASDSRC
jgi:hypothetical protein